jgi:hypothetical protein
VAGVVMLHAFRPMAVRETLHQIGRDVDRLV